MSSNRTHRSYRPTEDARHAFGQWCAMVIAAGAERVELRVELNDPDGGVASLQSIVRVIAPAPLYSWDVKPSGAADWVIDPAEQGGAVDPEAPSDIDRLVALLGAMEVIIPTVGVTLRGNGLLVEAGEVDDTIFWDLHGGPHYT